jgi:hypothetical protein
MIVADRMGSLIALNDGGGDVQSGSGGGAWGALSDSLWIAWRGMLRAEGRVFDVFGDELGEKLLVLWALSRFGDDGPGDGTLAELVDEAGRPRFGDWLAEDMLFAAFSLGVAWASDSAASEAQWRPAVLPKAAQVPAM